MSWSIDITGTPQGLRADLAAYPKAIVFEESRAEFAEAAPHLDALLALNTDTARVMHLKANGHAYTELDAGEKRRVSNVRVELTDAGPLTEA